MQKLSNEDAFLQIMQAEMSPALGCTEPIAVSYAAGVARRHAPGEIRRISCKASVNIIKNVASVTMVCGAIIAATGAACGIVALMGGGLPQTVSAVKNMLGNVAGMFCDGAKASCALKVSTCANAAVQAAILAMNTHYIKGTDGIVGNTADETVANYCRVLAEGMPQLDQTLLDIIISKEA